MHASSANRTEKRNETRATGQILDKRPPKGGGALAERFVGNEQRQRDLVQAAEEGRVVHEYCADVAGEARAPIDQQ